MKPPRTLRPPLPAFRILGFLPLAAVLAIAATRAQAPTSPPSFSNPLTIDNEFFPFVVGREKTFTGQHGNTDIVFIEDFTSATRAFAWNGGTVQTRVLEEREYENGEVVEISKNYFAQADDETAYYFGEVVDIYEGGVVTGHSGSWLVGGPTGPLDPPETATATDPAVFMPLDPQVGDTWKPEDLFPIVDETVLVEKTDVTITVPAGKFRHCLRVRETSEITSATERKWYSPGLGFLKSKGSGETLVLSEISPP